MHKTAIIALAAGVTAAHAGPLTFLTTRENSLFRTSGGAVEEFDMGTSLHSLTMTDQGLIGVSNRFNNFGSGEPEARDVLRLDGALGANPMFTNIGEIVEQPVPSMFVRNNGDLYGMGMGSLFVFNNDFSPGASVELIAPGLGGTAYDPESDTLYATESSTNSLISIDIDTGDVTTIGSLGFDIGNQGGEWFDGQYYTAVEDLDRGLLVVGTIDVVTAEFTEIAILDDEVDLFAGTIGFAVVPAPSSAAILGLGGLFAARRRR